MDEEGAKREGGVIRMGERGKALKCATEKLNGVRDVENIQGGGQKESQEREEGNVNG